jgi:hypothetical protein
MTDVTRWMRRPVSDRMLHAPKLSTCSETQEIRRPAMKTTSRAAARQTKDFRQQNRTTLAVIGVRADNRR